MITYINDQLIELGGVVGNNSGTTVKNCYNTGAVSGSTVGGVVGYEDSTDTVTKCYNTGKSGALTTTGIDADSYASKFSTYAIGYTAETTKPVTPSRPSHRPTET